MQRDARKPSRMDLGVQKAKKKLNVKGFVAIKKGTPFYKDQERDTPLRTRAKHAIDADVPVVKR